jgi:hypothetical protein
MKIFKFGGDNLVKGGGGGRAFQTVKFFKGKFITPN